MLLILILWQVTPVTGFRIINQKFFFILISLKMQFDINTNIAQYI